MNAPTVIVTACNPSEDWDNTLAVFDRSLALAHKLNECGLPLLLVTDQTAPESHCLMPGRSTLHRTRLQALNVLDRHVEALVEGVLLSSRAAGWIWVPSDTPMLSPMTVLAVASALTSCPLVHAEHAQQSGIPLGVGSEFYSELIQLGGYRDMMRFRTRYPALGVSVNDPGAIMSESGGLDMDLASHLPRHTRISPGPH